MNLSDAKFHFIGVGGVGMSALAELLHRMGAEVSGSDIRESHQTRHLKKIGVQVDLAHDRENIRAPDAVVYSSAIQESNPEVQEARRRRIPIIPRAEALAEIMRYKRGIAIAGTHGKTTTTSMLASIFLNSDLDPTIAVGGRLKLIESTARLGNGPWIVAEADESDGSFSRLGPEISVITNIDSDHLDHFGSFANIQEAFLQFALKVPFYGLAIVNGDDEKTKELFHNFPKNILFYGEKDCNDFILKGNHESYSVFERGKKIGEFHLQVPGVHNGLNALAACIAAHQTGLDWGKCFNGVNQYSGVDRRFQFVGEQQGVQVFDDYAHHPTEVQATLQGAKEKFTQGQLHILFQPHRYSRTEACWQDFVKSFTKADKLYLLDIYPAGESPIAGVDSQSLAEQISGDSEYCQSFEDALGKIKQNLKSGDIVMTMGAGNVWQCGPMLLELLES